MGVPHFPGTALPLFHLPVELPPLLSKGVPIPPTPHELELYTDVSNFDRGMNKQGGRVRYLSVSVDGILLWFQSYDILLSARHTRQFEHRSGRTLSVPMVLQTEWTLPRSPTADLAGSTLPNGRSLLHQVQPPAGNLRLPGPRHRYVGSGHFCRFSGLHSWPTPFFPLLS